jgi:hypothetical protein
MRRWGSGFGDQSPVKRRWTGASTDESQCHSRLASRHHAPPNQSKSAPQTGVVCGVSKPWQRPEQHSVLRELGRKDQTWIILLPRATPVVLLLPPTDRIDRIIDALIFQLAPRCRHWNQNRDLERKLPALLLDRPTHGDSRCRAGVAGDHEAASPWHYGEKLRQRGIEGLKRGVDDAVWGHLVVCDRDVSRAGRDHTVSLLCVERRVARRAGAVAGAAVSTRELRVASCESAPTTRNSQFGVTSGPRNLLLIGLAAGTVSELYTNIYGPILITGVELDPQIIEVGRRYFGMNQPNLTAIAADGRRWLRQQPADARWDVVAIDAYRPPYIPFHLTTVEFFQLVRSHLREDGVVAINVVRTATNFALVDALAATLAQVFPTVYAIDEPGPADNLGNTLLVATVQPTSLQDFAVNISALPETMPAEFRQFAQKASAQAREVTSPPDALIFTDDRAPVEQVVHQIILDFMVRDEQ